MILLFKIIVKAGEGFAHKRYVERAEIDKPPSLKKIILVYFYE